MSVIVIKGTDKKNARLIIELAKQLGGKVSGLSDEQYEDIMLGKMMDEIKTGIEVSKPVIKSDCLLPPQ
jgi:hypothetical protein